MPCQLRQWPDCADTPARQRTWVLLGARPSACPPKECPTRPSGKPWPSVWAASMAAARSTSAQVRMSKLPWGAASREAPMPR